jgi:hypothetical protein
MQLSSDGLTCKRDTDSHGGSLLQVASLRSAGSFLFGTGGTPEISSSIPRLDSLTPEVKEVANTHSSQLNGEGKERQNGSDEYAQSAVNPLQIGYSLDVAHLPGWNNGNESIHQDDRSDLSKFEEEEDRHAHQFQSLLASRERELKKIDDMERQHVEELKRLDASERRLQQQQLQQQMQQQLQQQQLSRLLSQLRPPPRQETYVEQKETEEPLPRNLQKHQGSKDPSPRILKKQQGPDTMQDGIQNGLEQQIERIVQLQKSSADYLSYATAVAEGKARAARDIVRSMEEESI